MPIGKKHFDKMYKNDQNIQKVTKMHMFQQNFDKNDQNVQK